jgi:glycosyltransferase involved in cell wall biosynthesis
MIEKSKILFVTTHFAPDYHFGGVVESGTRLLNNIRKLGVDSIRLICVSKNPTHNPDCILEDDLVLKSNFFHSWGFSFTLFFKLFTAVAQSDKLFINGVVTFPTTLAAIYALILKKKYVVSIRGGLEPWRRNHKKWKKHLYFKIIVYPLLKRSAAIHTTSEEEASNLKNLGFENIFTISNGIDLENYNVLPIERKEDDKFKFLFLSRTDKEKGIDILLDAYEIFCQQNDVKNHELQIVGPDNQNYLGRKKIDFESRNIKYSTGVYNEEKVKLLVAADVLVLPSYSENFGNVIAESLICQTPVITTVGTPWRMIEEVGCGLYIHPEVAELVNAMEKMYNMPSEQLEQMGYRGTVYIRKNFLWSQKAVELILQLEKVS